MRTAINQQDCLPSIIDILNKEHKSTFNIENKAIEDFIHNGIKSEIKKANLDGKTNINVELPNHFNNIYDTAIILNTLISNKLETRLTFTNQKPILHIKWNNEFLTDLSIDINSIFKTNILDNHKDIFKNKKAENSTYKITLFHPFTIPPHNT